MRPRPPRAFLAAEKPLGFAHRGGAALFPENTLLAFERALALGCRYLETDVHLTRDGAIVVFHDERLERTTDGAGFVAERTLDELRRLDAGYHFRAANEHPWRGRGLVVPRFEELVELSSDARFNVELKVPDPRLIQGFWQLIERYELHERVLVAAATDSIVRAFRKLSRGSVATSAGTREVQLFWAACRTGLSAWLPLDYDALQVPVRAGRLRVVDPNFVKAAHERGIQVHVWTIDDPSEMRELLELGADGIMSDRPDLMLEILSAQRGT
jgi:glycerophosphoryl diester phosphodiesterase